MTKADIIYRIAKESGMDRKVVALIVDSLMDCIKQSLIENGSSVFLRGFGTFSLKNRKTRIARDISRNEKIIVPAREVPHFKPSDAFLIRDFMI